MASEAPAGHRSHRHGRRRSRSSPTCWPSCWRSRPARVEELCAELEAAYRDEDRGFELVRVAGGYRFQSHADLAPYVERFVLEGQAARLSAAALETLAIVAYKQPVSRAQIASIRGVNADGVIRTLQARGFIAEVGRDPGPGQAVLYGTTPLFLERLGLDRIEELPPLAQFVPGPEIMDALEHSLRRADAGDAPRGRRPGSGRRCRTEPARPAASGCRRCWPGPGVGSRRACEELDRGRAGPGQRRGRQPGPAGRPWPRPGHRRRRARRRPPRPGLLPAQQAGRRGHHRLRPAGPADGHRPGAGRAAGLPGRAAWTPTARACCCSPTTET